MRSFEFIYLLLFLLFYLSIGFTSFFNCRRLTHSKKFNWGYWSYTVMIIFIFVFLYIYPKTPRGAQNYLVYFYFNAFLFIDLAIKIILSFSFVFGFFFSNKRIVSYAGIILATGLSFGMLYGMTGGKNELKTTNQDLSFYNLPPEFNNFKILQISDIHLGSFQKSNMLLPRVEKKINEIHPDLILFTGDLVNNFAYETEGWTELFERINSVARSFSILGNHDYGDYTTWANKNLKAENFKEIVDANALLGFELLRNKNEIIYKGGDSIFIVGVENWGLPPFPQHANLEKASKGIPDNAFKILLTHDPAHWEEVVKEKRNFQLTLSGHTHGLQWGIKTAGIPFSLAYLVRNAWGGLYQDGDTYLNVNTGLGTVGIPWRIDMPAEITVFTLKRVEVN